MAKAKTKASNVVVWIILILLIIGLAGFGATNFGGSVQSVGNVGDAQIPVDRYARALDQEIRSVSAQLGQNLSLAEAQQFNVQGRVLQRLLGGASMQQESTRVGVSVGDAEISTRIRSMQEFQGISGEFETDTYEFVLERTGLTPRSFEAELRYEMAGNILQAGVTAVLEMPASFQDTLVRYLGESRSFSWAVLDQTTLPAPVSEPDEQVLRAHYRDNDAEFMLPETRAITYAWLSPEAVADTTQTDEAGLRALYEARADEFNQPERRLVERLVFADDATAAEAMASIGRGDTTFDALVAQRGLDLEDVDMGDVTQAELGAAGQAVFALTEPGLAGPAPTSLGPAIFRVNAILQPRVTAFEEVEDELQSEFALDAARREIADRIGEFDDLLAGGASVEELADEAGMTLGRIDWTAEASDGIAAYEGFAAAAATASENDFPQIIELEDGGVFALRLDQIIAPRAEPFADARDKVAEAWRKEETLRLLLEKASTLKVQLDPATMLSSLGYITNVETALRRGTFIEGAPGGLLTEIFKLQPGGTAVIEDGTRVVLAQLNGIEAADLSDPELAGLAERIGQDARQSLVQDILEAYTRSIQTEAGIAINQAALNAVHAQFP